MVNVVETDPVLDAVDGRVGEGGQRMNGAAIQRYPCPAVHFPAEKRNYRYKA